MKHKLFFFLSLVLSVFSFGQVQLTLTTDKKDYNADDVVEATILLKIEGLENVRESPLQLPDFSKFNVIGSGSTSQTIIDSETDLAVNEMLYKVILQPRHSGSIKIGSALVKVNGKIHKTEPFDINVKEKSLAKITPLEAHPDLKIAMEITPKSVFLNQAFLAIIKAYSSDFNNFHKLSNVVLPTPKNAKIYPVNLNRSEISKSSTNSKFYQILAIYMVFPSEAGDLQLPPALITFRDAPKTKEILKSNSSQIKVKTLPAEPPRHFKNAVGSFTLDISSDTTFHSANINQPIEVRLTLKGTGNLSKECLPKVLESKDYKIFSPRIVEKINKNSKKKNLEGSVTAKYVIVPTKPGELHIQTEDFAYFNPETERYVELEGKKLVFNVLQPQSTSGTKKSVNNEAVTSLLDKVKNPGLPSNIIGNSKGKFIQFLENYYLLISATLAILLAFIIFLVKRKKTTPSFSSKNDDESIHELEEKIKSSLSFNVQETQAYSDELLNKEDFEGYLGYLDDFLKKLEAEAQNLYQMPFKKVLAQNKGQDVAEKFSLFVEQIKMEKYAPSHTLEVFKEIHQKFKSLIHQFS